MILFGSIGRNINPKNISLHNIADLYYTESFDNIKKELYMKVQSVLKDAKLQQYQKEKEKIQNEKVGLFGRFNGKKALKEAKLRNIDLKIQLASQQEPEPQPGKYGVHETLISMYECSISELDGIFSPEMSRMQYLITQNIDESGRPFNLAALQQEAQRRVWARQQNNLPVVQGKSMSTRKQNKLALEQLDSQNSSLNSRLSYLQNYNRERLNNNYFSKNNYANQYDQTNKKPDIIEILHYGFEQPIRDVDKEVSSHDRTKSPQQRESDAPEFY